MCMCLARAGVGGEWGEWIRELGLCLGFSNHVGTGRVLDVCLYLDYGGVGGVGGEWVGTHHHHRVIKLSASIVLYICIL